MITRNLFFLRGFIPAFFSFFLISALGLRAQVSVEPVFPNTDDDVVITFDATQGNSALTGISPVFAHMGVITNQSSGPSDWKYVKTTWGIIDPVGEMTQIAPNIWQKTINIRTFFSIPPNETVLKLSFVFRNTNGSVVGRAADGGDIFYDVYPENGPLQTRFVTPTEPSLLVSTGAIIAVKGASSKPGTISLYDNGALVTSANGELLETSLTAGTVGLHTIELIADANGEKDTSTFIYIVPALISIQDPPAGSAWGITRLSPTSMRLVLYAPGKQVVYAIGDFSNWLPNPTYQMKRSLNNNLWWIDIENLPVGQPVRFQYLVNGVLRIADPLSTLVLDPWNDPYIPSETFPNLPPYPTLKTSGIVSWVNLDPPTFNWTAANYQRPKKTDLVIYEMLLRDFIQRHDYQTLTDSLDYLQRLGVTAIELMPINEFDGNISWGYNPSFHKALDKYYGSPEALKTFVDECHKRNIAVILDVVFNQASGSSPLAQLYWDAQNNRPASNNPWLNPIAKHEFNVFNDFNHESFATKTYVKNCLKYWLEEFKVDGFRFDLSKGFTQLNTLGSVDNWGKYDASRIAILKEYANHMWSVDPTAYVILEHFAENIEEKELAEYGMMVWGNAHFDFKEIGNGFTTTRDLSWASYQTRGWNVPHVISYMESHDEERLAYEMKTYGNQANGYDIRTHFNAMRRLEMLSALLYAIPGPKMLWQFGELGYDAPINLCENGNIDGGCRTSPKPIYWGYFTEPHRRRLYDVTASLLYLKQKLSVFETTNFTTQLGSGRIRSVTLIGADTSVYVVANVFNQAENAGLTFPKAGTWYEYFTGDSLLVSAPNSPINTTLTPGEYRVYINYRLNVPSGLNPTSVNDIDGPIQDVVFMPNPVADKFFLAYVLSEPADVRLQVFDLAGRTVYEAREMGQGMGERWMEVETSNWPTGIYWARLSTGASRGVVQKFIKQ